jgi:hypothetical protein
MVYIMIKYTLLFILHKPEPRATRGAGACQTDLRRGGSELSSVREPHMGARGAMLSSVGRTARRGGQHGEADSAAGRRGGQHGGADSTARRTARRGGLILIFLDRRDGGADSTAGRTARRGGQHGEPDSTAGRTARRGGQHGGVAGSTTILDVFNVASDDLSAMFLRRQRGRPAVPFPPITWGWPTLWYHKLAAARRVS